MIGQDFVDKCISTDVITTPWPHQIIENTFDKSVFEKLKAQCIEKLNFPTTELVQIHPKDYKDYGIDFYDGTFVKVYLKILKYYVVDIQNIDGLKT